MSTSQQVVEAVPEVPQLQTEGVSLVGLSEAADLVASEASISEEPITPDRQFVEDVSRWIQGWLSNASEQRIKASKACVFLFSADGDPSQLLPKTKPAPMFRKLFDQELSGFVHVSAVGLRNVIRRKVGFADASAALGWLVANTHSDTTAVVFVPSDRTAMVRYASTDANDCEQLRFGRATDHEFDFTKVDDLLAQFHDQHTKTHLGWCRIWSKANERILKPFPEQQIQGSLRAFFEYTVRPAGVLIDEEFQTQMGRGDVRLVRWVTGADGVRQAVEVCMMELKVLSKKKSEPANTKWALDGIQQVLDYRSTSNGPGPDYLCCFDGRQNDADIPAVETRATEVSVSSKRFFMTTPGCPP